MTPTPIQPDTLTRDQVRDLLHTIRCQPHKFEEGLASHCTTWLRWDESGRDHNEYNARRAARSIVDALNAQDR